MLEGAIVYNIRFWCLRAPVCLCHISKSWWPLFTAILLLQVRTCALLHMLLEDPIIFYTSVRIFIRPCAISLVLNHINYYSVAFVLSHLVTTCVLSHLVPQGTINFHSAVRIYIIPCEFRNWLVWRFPIIVVGICPSVISYQRIHEICEHSQLFSSHCNPFRQSRQNYHWVLISRLYSEHGVS